MKEQIKKYSWINGQVLTLAGAFPTVGTELSRQDIVGGWTVRWGINRMGYRINPGLYATGKPDASSPVLVTANYKLTFDSLRKHLKGISAWILVLDTMGINVWCAAGKGTFGTAEVIRRVRSVNLHSAVGHRKLILPQLGAPGVAAHEVTKQTGFKVIYGPVRAADLPRFLADDCTTDAQMRTVTFTLPERLAVVPVELVQSWKVILGAIVFVAIAQILSGRLLSLSTLTGLLPYAGAIIIGCVVTPAFLPYIPGRSFAFKGWLAGVIAVFIYVWLDKAHPADAMAELLLLPAISSYLALNFTGCSTYTSLSGVKKEMRIALPLLILSAFCGIIISLYRAWLIR